MSGLWVIAVGGPAAFAHAAAIGAAMVSTCWGPAVGARVMTYRTAALLGAVFQTVGALGFGRSTTQPFGEVLGDWTVLQPHPQTTVYTLMWIIITSAICQWLAVWRCVLVPSNLALVAFTIGAAIIFPGAAGIDAGQTIGHLPFLSGIGPITIVWMCAAPLSALICFISYLSMRSHLMRGEDPFHTVLWSRPADGCMMGVVLTLYTIYVIGPPPEMQSYDMPLQEIVVLAAGIGCVSCLSVCLIIPCLPRQMTHRGPSTVGLKRMNLLGLDDAIVHELATARKGTESQSWLQWVNAWLFDRDVFKGVSTDDVVMRIHATAEEFDAGAEKLFTPWQILAGIFLSTAYGANVVHISVGTFASMHGIHTSGVVHESDAMTLQWRLLSAGGMLFGSLLFGFRLVPFTGVQLAKMTTFRSHIVLVMSVLAVTELALLQLRNSPITYVLVAAIAAVGAAAGIMHVNWQQLGRTVVWWVTGFIITQGVAALLVAQGLYAPSMLDVEKSSEHAA